MAEIEEKAMPLFGIGGAPRREEWAREIETRKPVLPGWTGRFSARGQFAQEKN